MPNAALRSAIAIQPHPLVSVIIPHFNDLSGLAACLAGLQCQTWPPHAFEVIVADNNSACGLDAVRQAAGGATVIHAHVQGAGPARNAGVEAAHGRILAFIDSDCRPAQDWIEHGVAALRSYDFAGGQVRTIPQDSASVTPVEAWEMEFGFDFERYVKEEGYTGSGNMWVWREVFDDVGGFRAGVSEDMDWSFRARAAGFSLGYQPAAIVSHYARRDWAELATRWRRVIREHYLLTSERRFGNLRWTAKTMLMPASVLPHLLRVARSRRLPTAGLKLSAATVLVRHRLWRTRLMWGMARDCRVRAAMPATV